MALKPTDIDQTARVAVRAAIDEQVDKAIALFDLELLKIESNDVTTMVDRVKLQLWIPADKRDEFHFADYGPGMDYFRDEITKRYEEAGWGSVDVSFEYDTARFHIYRLDLVLIYPEPPPPPAEFAA